MTFEGEWARCAPWLEAALNNANEGYKLADVLAAVQQGEATFWPFRHAALVTQALGDEAHYWLAGGSLNCLLAARPNIEARLLANGFEAVTIKGRLGWGRALRPFGYVLCGDKLRKVLL